MKVALLTVLYAAIAASIVQANPFEKGSDHRGHGGKNQPKCPKKNNHFSENVMAVSPLIL